MIMQRLQAATGLYCPVCLLAIMSAAALAAISVLAITLDHGHSRQQATLNARSVAELAGQRTADLLLRIDGTLRGMAGAASAADPDAAARLDLLLAQRRRAEPRLLGLFVIGPDGRMMASSSSAQGAALGQACLHDGAVEIDQVTLRPVRGADQNGTTAKQKPRQSSLAACRSWPWPDFIFSIRPTSLCWSSIPPGG
jgi:hypothetical protein